jgi:predicted Rossmann-fold nucleotide-binding protein
VAAKRVASLREALGQSPGDEDLLGRLDIAERIPEKSRHYQVAREFCRLVAESGEGPRDSRLVVLVGESFWRRVFDVDFPVDEGVIDSEDRDLFWYADTAEEIRHSLQLWYHRAGEPIIAGDALSGRQVTK